MELVEYVEIEWIRFCPPHDGMDIVEALRIFLGVVHAADKFYGVDSAALKTNKFLAREWGV